VVQLQEGADPAGVVASLKQTFKHTKDVDVLTREDFRQREIRFWDRATPIGIIFLSGTLLGFGVGMIICYQIIYSDISDHIAEFATLKAMGYTRFYFIRLIVRQSVYLSLLGFVPGVLLSWGVFQIVSAKTGLMMSMTPWHRVALVLVLTMVMCITSGLLALRKLEAMDPADLF
jgi:putative ABC transport system permease protein